MPRFTLLLSLFIAGMLAASAAKPAASLWDRLGGLAKLKSALADTVDRHFDDPLTAPYFGPHKFDNNGDREYVKQQVLHFFSAGTGGPYGYDGKDMLSAHAKMDISETAFHALSYHLLAELERHGAGGPAEREECLTILHSLKPIVQAQGKAGPEPPSPYDPIGQLHNLLTGVLPRYLQGLPLPRDVASLLDLTLDDAFALLPTIVLLASPLLLAQLPPESWGCSLCTTAVCGRSRIKRNIRGSGRS